MNFFAANVNVFTLSKVSSRQTEHVELPRKLVNQIRIFPSELECQFGQPHLVDSTMFIVVGTCKVS